MPNFVCFHISSESVSIFTSLLCIHNNVCVHGSSSSLQVGKRYFHTTTYVKPLFDTCFY